MISSMYFSAARAVKKRTPRATAREDLIGLPDLVAHRQHIAAVGDETSSSRCVSFGLPRPAGGDLPRVAPSYSTACRRSTG